MRIKIVERSTGIGIATEDSFERALQKARERKVAPQDMQYVVGEPDIELYEYARNWAGLYRWLPGYFREKGAQEYFVESAVARLELWEMIGRSRIVDSECDIAPRLSAVIGESLAADVAQLIRLDRAKDCEVYGPDVKSSWSGATKMAIGLSSRYSSRNYVLAVHEALGAIVVAPDYMVVALPGFRIKKDFVRGRAI